ncbi:hypothetical protein HQ531_04380 [bacterium]|nr:hypothetical protein [bacterium]
MNKTASCILISLMLVAPLFSALLTKDLQVEIPTGNPVMLDAEICDHQFCSSPSVVQLHFMESPQGVLIAQEFLKVGSSWSIQNLNESNNGEWHLVICQSTKNGSERKILSIDVNLE